MSNFPEKIKIETERLILTPLTLADIPEFYGYRALPQVYKYQTWYPKDLSDAEQFITRYSLNRQVETGHWLQLGIYLKPKQELIGDSGFLLIKKEQAEIGYTISPKFQKQGFATESTRALVQYLFNDLGIDLIIARTDPANFGSIRILQKLKFCEEGLLKQSIQIRGKWCDDLKFSLKKF